jgi:histidinol phosphatase-like PHP family hydrolase
MLDTTYHTAYNAMYDPDYEEIDLTLAVQGPGGTALQLSMAADLATKLVDALEAKGGAVEIPDRDHDGNPNGETILLEVGRQREDTALNVKRKAGAMYLAATFALTPPSVNDLGQQLKSALSEAFAAATA